MHEALNEALAQEVNEPELEVLPSRPTYQPQEVSELIKSFLDTQLTRRSETDLGDIHVNTLPWTSPDKWIVTWSPAGESSRLDTSFFSRSIFFVNRDGTLRSSNDNGAIPSRMDFNKVVATIEHALALD